MGRPNAFDGMMHEFCANLGWCGGVEDRTPLHVSDFIPDTGPVSADQFASWLIMAEGLDPDLFSASERSQLKTVFVKHMGTDVVDASKLRSGHHSV
ncbi:hypothetical protein [Bradyrhizobium sp. cf659]|uniref:hypothetical protein n=1 Tax=Bradyrhizobium sp. cf659 TaxID=1761771 RepID=UPI0008E97FE3|nr:hypothetical protein [Bradyrhizobium sp. cf659]SFJ01403.1 hypothetical protein SAMN04487925_104573 [Bradyrhizobium sp. cf659]